MQTETKLFAGLYYSKIFNIIYDIHIIYSPLNEETFFFLFINKSALKVEEKINHHFSMKILL